MILSLWITLVSLSLIMVVLGLTRPEHSEQALIGFFFLFLLSFSIINNDLEYPTGNINESSYYVYGNNFTGYHWDYSEPYDVAPHATEGEVYLFHVEKTISIEYETYGEHNFGYWLAVAMAVSMAGVLWQLKKIKSGAK